MQKLLTLLLAGGFALSAAASQPVVDKTEKAQQQLQRYQSTTLRSTKQLKRKMLSEADALGLTKEQGTPLRAAASRSASAQELPYSYTFDDMSGISVVDANNDGLTWSFFDGYGCVRLDGSSESAADDWLIFTTPLNIKAGNNHIVFQYMPRFTNPKESFEVYIGTSTNHAEMTKIGEVLEFRGFSSYQKFTCDFTIEAEGEYYFAIRAVSPVNHGGIYIDNLEVNTGAHIGNPNAGLINVLMPQPSPNLTSAEKISLVVENTGEEDIKFLTVNWYDESGYQLGYFDKVFSTPIAPGEKAEFQLEDDMNWTDEFDFSYTGLYRYEFEIADVISSTDQRELDTKLGNNYFIGRTSHLKSNVELPFNVDFSNNDYQSLWYSLNGVWFFDDFENFSIVGSDVAPLYSASVALESGKKYRFEYEALIGTDIDGYYAYSTDFDVRIGKVGTDINEWQVIENVEWGINEKFEEFDCTFSVEESGEYQFAVVITSNGGLEIRKISVSDVYDYELRMTQAFAPTMLPLTLANKFPTMGAFTNKGARMINAKFDLKNGDEVLGTYTENDITPKASGAFTIVGNKANATVGEELNLSIVPSVEGHDNAVIRAAQLAKTTITKDIYGYDQITEDMLNVDFSVGCEPGSDITCAMVFTLAEEAVVTGMQIGWAGTEATSNAIAIREYNPVEYTLGEVIISDVVSKAEGCHFGTYPLAPRKLAAGTYAALVTLHDYQMAADWIDYNHAYILDSSGQYLFAQPQVGAIAIRLQFGEVEDKATDVAVVKISKPVSSGYFASNEPVVADVAQLGSQDVEAIATLKVNGTTVEEKPVTIPAFSEVEIEFEADLLAKGKYVLEVSLAAEGDADLTNNTSTLTVESLGELSKYVLDFEACEDFSIDQLNPNWTMVDEDGDYTYGLGSHVFPNAGEPCAFIVFNIWGTDFEEGTGLFNNLLPHGGVRYGAAFCEMDYQNNDWLISPKLMMDDTNPELRFFARSYTLDYGAETFKVHVSETDNELSSFTTILDATADYAEWQEVVVPLTDYAGKEIHVAIECTSSDRYMFMIDDITITEPSSTVSVLGTLAETNVNLYPTVATEAVTITAANGIQNVSIYSVSGQMVYNTEGNDSVARINVELLAAGVYLAKVETTTGTRTIRFIVK